MAITFSIVTPTFNSRTHLRETMLSVLGQCGDFAIEYLVVDNASKDGTLEMIREFQKALSAGTFPRGCLAIDLRVISEPDRGMYDAINKGFLSATGNVFAWINADDVYLPGAFATVARVMTEHRDVEWLKGVTSYLTEGSILWRAGNSHVYAREWILAGLYGRDCHFIQQDSVFWRSEFWRQCGGMATDLKLAGDYALWIRLARHAPLVSVGALLSCFRAVPGQLSENRQRYLAEMERVRPTEVSLGRKVRGFLRVEGWIPRMARRAVFRLLFGDLRFSAILVDRAGNMARVDGDYYRVTRALAAYGPTPTRPEP